MPLPNSHEIGEEIGQIMYSLHSRHVWEEPKSPNLEEFIKGVRGKRKGSGFFLEQKLKWIAQIQRLPRLCPEPSSRPSSS